MPWWSVQVPAVVREGDRVPVTVVVRTNQAGPATLVIESGGETQLLDVDLVSGRNEVDIEIDSTGVGFLSVAATIEACFDTRTENNRAEGITRILGPAKVAVVEGVEGEADASAGRSSPEGSTSRFAARFRPRPSSSTSTRSCW